MNELEFETLNGYFLKTIYKSDSYMVTRFESDDGLITVTGPSFDYSLSEKYTIKGQFIEHQKYGFQFSMLTINKYIPDKKDEIIKFLSSSSFKGVGKKAATKIYNKLGDNCLKVINDDNSVVYDLGLTDKQIQGLLVGMESIANDDNETILLLITAGFSNSEANRICFHFKDNTAFIFNDNPYRFYLDVYGIPFKKVMQCAKNLEIEDKEYKFKEAYLVYLFKEISFQTGNTYLNEEEFKNEYERNYNDFDIILKMCIDDNQIIKEDDRYYYFQEYYDEKYIVDYFKFDKESLLKDELNIKEEIIANENQNNIKYDEYQIDAIYNFFNEDFSMVIGGPGTGKTTLIKTMVNMFKEFYPYHNIMVVAPTGRAAKRINEMCEVESKTIHSLLKWNKETNTFIHKNDNPILYDCLIIDEFSMVDNNLFASLLKASQYIKKICVIGDDNQLPSIRQGNVLKDLILSNRFKITYLKNNHRQKEGNDIIALANDIVNHNVDFSKYKNDIAFYDINNINVSDLILMIKDDINNGYDLDDIQVLSPMYKGEYGIDNLNNLIQNSFNPPSPIKKEKKIGKITFRERDKILQLKNRPTDDVYNGDIGILEEIDEEEKCLVVDFQNIKVFYENDDMNDISLAYALSVHKAQGSEYKIVYFICSNQHYHMLYQKLIYTAISRAKIKLIIIGDINTFNQGINREINLRKTSLLKHLND